MATLFQTPAIRRSSVCLEGYVNFSDYLNDDEYWGVVAQETAELSAMQSTCGLQPTRERPLQAPVDVIWPTPEDPSHLATDGTGSTVSILHLTNSTVEQSVEPPVQLASANFAEMGVVKAVWESGPLTKLGTEIEV